ncbi:MAG: class I SAM-dependent methyltransferase, partial [Phycisphaerales bacterium]|nr:class I SAM-dependent methyltransferase [Phycisphaerales bacterium]
PGARRDIRYHYDLGNDLYRLFLDPSMTYSCAFFERPGMTLEEAQEAKYRRLCDRLGLGPDSHVLEIGCGWGGFALHAAGEWGARVTGVTLSEEQAALARERVATAAWRSCSRTTAPWTGSSPTSPRSRCWRRSATASCRCSSGRWSGCWRPTASPPSRPSPCPTSGTSATAAATTGSASTSSRAP